MINVLNGKLEFLKMVRGSANMTYQQLKGRFEKLVDPIEEGSKDIPLDIDLIIEVFVKKGLGEAMELFKQSK